MSEYLSDPAVEIVTAFQQAMAEAFDPSSPQPPSTGSTTVRFFGGDAIPMAAWEAHASGGCEEPFLWVRIVRRYRSEEFPVPTIDTTACGLARVMHLEVGVGRCAVVDLEPTWKDYAIEAAISLDDSWRVELALCRAGKLVRGLGYSAATGDINPYGPEGGVVAWTGDAYVQF